MGFGRSLRQLWRHRYFRRLLAVRVAIQSCDGVLQVALASYVLFSPSGSRTRRRSRSCWPSPAPVFDRWAIRRGGAGPGVAPAVPRGRQPCSISGDPRPRGAGRDGLRTSGIETLLYGGVLVAMSLNRFLLAALSASLPHTIEASEYMVANSVVPCRRSGWAFIGVGVATSLRLILGQVMPDYRANAILFAIAAAGFVLSAALALRIPRRQLGPDDVEPTKARDIVVGLVDALGHLRDRRAAASVCRPSRHIGSSTASSRWRQSWCIATTSTASTRSMLRSLTLACLS